MKTKGYILMFIIIPVMGFSQQELLKTKTYFIGNRHFIVYDSILHLDIDYENGEDLKSKTYSYYFNQLNKKYPQWKNKTTIASGYMDIDLNIINKTQSSWNLQAIKLIIIGKNDIQFNKNDIHKWPYSFRGEEDEIHFDISNKKNSYIYIPENIIITKPNEGDNLLNISINTNMSFEKKHKILTFKFELDFTEIGNTNNIKILSDKTYYIYTYSKDN